MVLFRAIAFSIQLLCLVTNNCGPDFGAPVPVNQQKIISKSIERSKKIPNFPFQYDLPDKHPIVEIETGAIRGYLIETIEGRKIAAFTKIPYLEPPIGNLRFREPVRKRRWSGVLNTMKQLPICEQLDPTQLYRVLGQEDCLYMSVFSPTLDKNANLPVIVYIHGGAFFFGSGNFGPSYILNKDVILVTFNFRLGPLGFLSTGDLNCPGNNGLKDQQMALMWVSRNIRQFGGDPNRVTLVGHSSGGVGAHLHAMNDKTKGLFNGAVLHSGSAFEHWGIRHASKNLTNELARNLNCENSNSEKMLNCLRRVRSAKLVAGQVQLFKYWYFPPFVFGPVIEIEHPNAIITKSPAQLYKEGKVAKIPIISGFVRNEGELYGLIFELIPGIITRINLDWDKYAPFAFDVDSYPDKLEIVKKIREFYLGQNNFDYQNRKAIYDAMGDRNFIMGVHKGLQYHSAYGAPTYGYYFNYFGTYGLANSFGFHREDWGIVHTDDMLYLFNQTNYFRPLKYTDPEYTVSKFVVNLWTNFAIKNKPVYTNDNGVDEDIWPRITNPRNMNYLEINEGYRRISEPFQNRIRFWEKLNLTKLDSF